MWRAGKAPSISICNFVDARSTSNRAFQHFVTGNEEFIDNAGSLKETITIRYKFEAASTYDEVTRGLKQMA